MNEPNQEINQNIKEAKSLYVPQLEKDSCGIGLIADLTAIPKHQHVSDALEMLENMEHRGACGAEPNSGDGAGILVQIPDAFFRKKMARRKVTLPAYKSYGVGLAFLPKKQNDKNICIAALKEFCTELDFEILGRRPIPVRPETLGASSLRTEPDMVQYFFKYKYELNAKELDRRLFLLRSCTLNHLYSKRPDLKDDFYFSSCSCQTMVYKGQLTTGQVREYFPDLSDPDFKSAIALVHSRFSTNTTPKWKLAQPFRCIAHNGEINTIQGNIKWWKSREASLDSTFFSKSEIDKLNPVCDPNVSDSGNFDNVLEFLIHNGKSIPHALMMMIPEAWQHDPHTSEEKKAFYQYSEALIEPWDGPASICFTDGTLVGATLDRNGLRPSRYVITKDQRLILASEAGVLKIDQASILKKGRLQPGKILIADLDEHRIIEDDELKKIICNKQNYQEWIKAHSVTLADLKDDSKAIREEKIVEIVQKQQAFGFTKEDEDILLKAMSDIGKEPIGSMGSDIPLAVLSTKAQHIASYFRQQFAQVTNPPIDPLRERNIMSLKCFLGPSGNILKSEEQTARVIRLESPILSAQDFRKINYTTKFKVSSIDCQFNLPYTSDGLLIALKKIVAEAITMSINGAEIIVLSNRNISKNKAAIPSMLTAGAVHHHLIELGLRHKVSLVIEGGDLIETQHMATSLSFGADAIYPFLAYQTVSNHSDKSAKNYLKALDKGMLKIMSKLGISCILSYQGAQTFEALGIASEVINYCFKNTVSRIEGMTFDMLAKEQIAKHKLAFEANVDELVDLGKYQWNRKGEYHLFNPTTIHLLQHSTSTGNYEVFKKFSEAIDDQAKKACTLRSFLDFEESDAIPIEEVESKESIFKRFATGAMSFGSLSHEAHSTLAIAMNRIGGKSNSGEGGEDEMRYKIKPDGSNERSAIKQVASGRFGVTSHYLSEADELQVKMAQGAKPGEGGQLPGHKVDEWIAKVRHSTPGVGLISPPPHHDIYSIEDLAQLIFDLKNANRKARISVKLVSKAGVGIIASGVTKAHADHILISGFDGGTGASPLSSIQYAGLPWELGLAESHQTLVKNGLRDRVTLQTDGQIRTGRDLAIATLLGAEEWGIATAALVVEGCILMRKCHLNTCPVGIATQDKDLRKKFNGKVEHLINYFTYLAEELREIMAELGFRTVNEMVGRSDFLKLRANINHWKWKGVDLSPLLHYTPTPGVNQFHSEKQNHGIKLVLDRSLIKFAKRTLKTSSHISSIFNIRSTDRAVGTMLSNEISKQYGSAGMPEDSISFRFVGSAGQSFGAFGAHGLQFTLEGEANDYLGKGLSGAKLILVPARESEFKPSKNIIVGNVAFYGATAGQAYIRGQAGERFAVRNSGAEIVIEGIGDNGCEYMTGGKVINLGGIGKNFGAGMSGGVAFIYKKESFNKENINLELLDIENPDDFDLSQIRFFIRNHLRYTGSKTAHSILDNWSEEKLKFLKIIPTGYKAIYEKNKATGGYSVPSKITA